MYVTNSATTHSGETRLFCPPERVLMGWSAVSPARPKRPRYLRHLGSFLGQTTTRPWERSFSNMPASLSFVLQLLQVFRTEGYCNFYKPCCLFFSRLFGMSFRRKRVVRTSTNSFQKFDCANFTDFPRLRQKILEFFRLQKLHMRLNSRKPKKRT